MGLLNSNSLNEWLTGIPERAREAYRGLLNAPSEVKQLFDPQFQQGLLKNATPVSREDIINQGLNISGMAPYGMAGHIVYHGSPHKFDKFDSSKIGTGEGAQAYGHGLYFAESPVVAEGYRKSLTSSDRIGYTRPGLAMVDNIPAKELGQDVWEVADLLASRGITVDDYISDLNKKLSATGASAERKETIKELLQKGNEVKDVLAGKNVRWEDPGFTYKVDLPDEAIPRMLDWDKPLSQQAPEVQAALEQAKNKQLRAMLDYAKVPYSEMAGGEAKTMGEAFRLLNLNLQGKSSADSAKASALLAKQGIPGIRYLDQGSRTAGEGTYNYVLFDDQLPRILEINGQPTGLLSWADEAKKVKKKK